MKKIIISGLLLSGLLVAGCANTHETNKKTAKIDAQKRISPKQAIQVFNDKYPNTAVTELELDDMLSKSKYKIEGQDDNQEHELTIDSHSKKVLHKESNKQDLDDEIGMAIQHKLDLKKAISMKKAMSIAEKSVKNSKTSSIKLTEDNNKMYWKAELKTPNNDDEHEVIMDAKTGKIIDKDIDD